MTRVKMVCKQKQSARHGTAKKNNDVSEEERDRDRDAMQRWEHHGNIVENVMGTSR
jgi:hypothetical protein